jgi:CHAT domain-containing protein
MALARSAFDREADATFKRRILPELAFAEAEISWALRPAAAVSAVRQAEQGFTSNSTRHRLLALAVIEARAQRRAGDPAAAEAALRKGVAIVDEQQRLIRRVDFQPSFIDASWDVFSELVDLKASSGDPEAALQWLDRGYDVDGRWQSQAGAVSWAEVSAAGPVVAYLSRPDALWVWVVRDGVVRQRRLPVTHRALVNRSARLARLLGLDGAIEALQAEAAALAAEVLWPATEDLSGDATPRVAFVLDPVLQQVPLALLPWSRLSSRRMVDVTATVLCPSVVACASTPEPNGVTRTRVAALYSAAGSGDLVALPLARAEAERIGRRHAGASVDTASQATLVAELRRADLVHFAGHAAPDERYPGRSSLVTSGPDGEGVRVPLARLLAGPVAAQTVLLSACRTSSAEQRRGHGGTGVAGEFLRAGVRHVVATQWDVQDQTASDVMDLVHEALARGDLPWDAVRYAQQVISHDAARHPRDWAGYVAFTSASVRSSATVSLVSMPPRAERP